MDNNIKPIPDVDCLKYKGTPEKPDIKIFVSHRIDLDSETIDNPLYIPVRCGAVYDERTEEEIGGMLGDDTGDNISEKRNSFCELTVQYWAWKNVEADYYGLCHYRRYMSFSDKKYDVSTYGVIEKIYPSKKQINEFGLDAEKIKQKINGFDAILTKKVDVTSFGPEIKSIKDYCEHSTNDFNLDDISILLDVIKEKYPEYYDCAVNYYNNPLSRWYNCYILKKDVFMKLCEWQFDILFEVEKRLDTNNYSSQKKRQLGFFGEHLFGIYFEYLKDNDSEIKIDERQLVLFNSTEKSSVLYPAFEHNNVAIVLMSSNYYVPYLTTAIQSIIDHSSKNNGYDIIVLHKEITDRNQKIIKQHFSNFKNLSIRFHNPKDIVAEGSFHVAASTYSEEAYYRVLVPWILKEYSKAITLDCDLISNADISNLYNMSLNNDEYCAATIDYVYHGMLNGTVADCLTYTKEEIGMDEPYNYVNTGVMLLNLESLRKNFTAEYIVKFLSSHKFNIQEQDALNALFENHIHFIDVRWNYYVEVNDFIKLCIKYAPVESETEYKNKEDSPWIIHYASNPKPWNAPTVMFGECWWSCARKTPFYEEILFRMSLNPVLGLQNSVIDVQNRIGVFDTRSPAKKVLDAKYPLGSKKRNILEKICPYGSRRWKFVKKLWYILHPTKRPKQ